MFWAAGFWAAGFWAAGFWADSATPIASNKIFVSKKVTFPFVEGDSDIIFLKRKVTFPVTEE